MLVRNHLRPYFRNVNPWLQRACESWKRMACPWTNPIQRLKNRKTQTATTNADLDIVRPLHVALGLHKLWEGSTSSSKTVLPTLFIAVRQCNCSSWQDCEVAAIGQGFGTEPVQAVSRNCSQSTQRSKAAYSLSLYIIFIKNYLWERFSEVKYCTSPTYFSHSWNGQSSRLH